MQLPTIATRVILQATSIKAIQEQTRAVANPSLIVTPTQAVGMIRLPFLATSIKAIQAHTSNKLQDSRPLITHTNVFTSPVLLALVLLVSHSGNCIAVVTLPVMRVHAISKRAQMNIFSVSPTMMVPAFTICITVGIFRTVQNTRTLIMPTCQMTLRTLLHFPLRHVLVFPLTTNHGTIAALSTLVMVLVALEMRSLTGFI